MKTDLNTCISKILQNPNNHKSSLSSVFSSQQTLQERKHWSRLKKRGSNDSWYISPWKQITLIQREMKVCGITARWGL